MPFLRVVLRSIIFFSIFVAVGAASADTIRFRDEIPILTVRGQAGQVSYLTLRLERDPDDRQPLSIAVSEDTPVGAGEALRASVWQAAMAVAMTQRDPLHGVRVYVSVRGYVDGPSAGSAIALAMLMALDGDQWPKDLAITGSILPDGSIGRVGGIHLKMMAAYRAGIKRILVPACLRFEYDEDKEVNVDLKVLAESLSLEYMPLETLRGAYRVIMGMTTPQVAMAGTLELPPYLDHYFKDIYTVEIIRYGALFEKLARPATGDETGAQIYLMAEEAISRGVQAANAGYLDVATHFLQEGMLSITSYLQAMHALESGSQRGASDRLNALAEKLLRTTPDPLRMLGDMRQSGLHLHTTQFMGDLATGQAITGFLRDLGEWRNELSSGKGKLSDDDRESLVFLDFYRAHSGAWLNDYYASYKTNMLALNSYFRGDNLVAADTYADTEQLLFSALLTTKTTFDSLIKSDVGTEGMGEVYAMLMFEDPGLALPFGSAPHSLHEAVLHRTGMDKLYLSAVAVQVYIKYIAELNRWVFMFAELDPQWEEDGSVRYGRQGLLHSLLRISREQALGSISQAREKHLPWIGAALAFRLADYSRDDPAIDKTEVLAGYWRAAMQADASLMMFQSGSLGDNVMRVMRTTFIEVVEKLPTVQPSLRRLNEGDRIVRIDGITVRSIDELVAVVASMPEGHEYDVVYMPKGSMQTQTLRATGGRMLGIQVRNTSMF